MMLDWYQGHQNAFVSAGTILSPVHEMAEKKFASSSRAKKILHVELLNAHFPSWAF